MNLTAPSEVRALLDRLGVRPNKTLGQNFLIDANILKILLSTADLHQQDAVLEVGPGLGVLTEWLARWSGRVVAVEKDRKLAAHLRERFAEAKNVELIESDVMDLDLDGLMRTGINKVVSNLPYAIASRLLVDLIQSFSAPERIVVTVQREVAGRLTARTGTKDYGLLSVLAQSRYGVEVRKEVSPRCFLPPPDVTSAIANLALLPSPEEEPKNRAGFADLVKMSFSQRRKQVGPSLRRSHPKLAPAKLARILESVEVDPRARPEDIAPAQWVRLSNLLASPPTR